MTARRIPADRRRSRQTDRLSAHAAVEALRLASPYTVEVGLAAKQDAARVFVVEPDRLEGSFACTGACLQT
jgi:hypothetical protein